MQSPFQIKISGNLGCGRSVERRGGLENLAFPSEALYFFFSAVYGEEEKKWRSLHLRTSQRMPRQVQHCNRDRELD